jgi:hypothetical protein
MQLLWFGLSLSFLGVAESHGCINRRFRCVLTRNTKELGHERLLKTVILGSLSERHWLFIYT